MPVLATHDGVQVLRVGGEEGPEGAPETRLSGLPEASPVCAPETAHVAVEGRIQGC